MATMISEVYDAFVAWANYDQRFDRVEREMLRTQAELTLLKWMVGFVIALDVAILIRVFFR